MQLKYTKENPLRILSLFSGIGAFEKSLTNIGVPTELVAFCEVDKYAPLSYCAIHGVEADLNLGDITKVEIEKLPTDIDMVTHGSPCQDFSVAGHGKGGDLGTETRSSLMWNTVAIVEHCKPNFVIWENVKNVLSKAHRHNFEKYLEEMDRLGYDSFWKVLNAKHYGTPQNRERIFVVSIKKELNVNFKFPEPFDNGIRLKDILQETVEEKYYINTERAEKLIEQLMERGDLKDRLTPCDSTIMKPKALEIANCITARYDAGIQNKQAIGVAVAVKEVRPIMNPDIIKKSQNGRRLKEDGEPMYTLTANDVHGVMEVTEPIAVIGSTQKHAYVGDGDISPTLTQAMGNGGGHVPMMVIPNDCCIDDTQGFDGVRVYDGYTPTLRAGRNGLKVAEPNRLGGLFDDEKGKHQAGSVWDIDGIAPTLDTMQGGYRQPCVTTVDLGYRIRKLTPTECWVLMTFDIEDINKCIAKGLSNTQLYKQAGNSICVCVLEEIFKSLLGGLYD